MSNSLILFGLLLGTWFILSGFFSPFFISMGVLSCALSVGIVTWLYRKEADTPNIMPLLWRLPVYMLWLIKEMFVSTCFVTVQMWKPRLEIDSSFKWIPLNPHTEIGLTIYANSITLTPGTVSIKVRSNQILVHALQRETLEDLKSGTMEKKITTVLN